MANRIGPTFVDELKAAGVPLGEFGWVQDTGELRFLDSASVQLRKSVADVLAGHDPTKPGAARVGRIDQEAFAQLLVQKGLISAAELDGVRLPVRTRQRG